MQKMFTRNCLVIVGVAVLTLMISACVVYQPYYYPASQYDRVWESAMKAAVDVGITMSSVDRDSGTIVGRKGPMEVTVSIQTQVDGTIRLKLNVKGPEDADPQLNDRFLQAYQLYMGR